MTRFFSRFHLSIFYLSIFYWCLVCLFPFVTHAKPIGEIIFRHPLDFRELWVGNVQEGHSARRVFRQELLSIELSIQKDGHYLVAVAERFIKDELHLVVDAYLFERKNWFIKEKNLTRGLFDEVLDAAISEKGDVVFTNRLFNFNRQWAPARGIYLILNREIKKEHPQVELLKEVEAHYVDWAPNEREITFDTADGIFLIDSFTTKVSLIIKDGYRPVFSPDGKKLAFLTRTKPTKLGVLSLTNLHNLKHIEIEGGVSPIYLTWSPDGQYIVYTLAVPNLTSENFAVPIAGGTPERILEMYVGGVPLFEWTHVAKSGAHAVEPANKLTTLWGKLKQQD
jgi:hypothetical protein